MDDQLSQITKQALAAIASVNDFYALDQVRSNYLGKKGELTNILKNLASVAPEQRPLLGQAINKTKDEILAAIANKNQELKNRELEANLAKEAIDITLPGRGLELGSIHPVYQAKRLMEDFFVAMGFSVIEGPEIEDEYHNFTALNIPPNHPARASHDTFYLSNDKLLRTHTSPMQIKAMKEFGAPLRIIVPGRVYRCDYDATHSPMFHQLEGLLIDRDVNFSNLKWLLNKFLESFFDTKHEVMFRPSYFPFTEPSADVFIKWQTASQTRWLEILGAGMVHPNVLRAGGIDPTKYSGFAFGMGIDRLAMLKYGVSDLRLFFENDLDFLRQF
ncbi:MAG: phenylalanine--tRNA ligase subunit alpha [Gammaproteobacteria bacterium]|nr:phenylalanine--tRNA ligase subunit alpha [Gammaproteobacteria bacterium]